MSIKHILTGSFIFLFSLAGFTVMFYVTGHGVLPSCIAATPVSVAAAWLFYPGQEVKTVL